MLYFIFRQPEAVAYKCDKLGIGGLVAVKAYLTVKLVLNELAVSVLPVPCGGYGMAYGSLHTGGCGLIGLGNGRVEPLCYAVKDGHILGSEHYCRTQISVTLYIGWYSHFLDYLRNCSFKAALAACPQRRLFSVRCRSVAKIFLQKLFKFPFPAAAMDKAKFVKCRRFRCDNKTWRIMLDVLEKAEYF